jgi:hypothetical protein
LAQLARVASSSVYRRLRVRSPTGARAAGEPNNFNINWACTPQAAPTSCRWRRLKLHQRIAKPSIRPGLYGMNEAQQLPANHVGSFAKSRGRALDDDRDSRVFTIQAIEQTLVESSASGKDAAQNIALMIQALGLGGYPNFARHEYGWFEALDFRMGSMPSTKYVGASSLITFIMNLLGRNQPYPYPLGLERDGQVLLKPFCPPYYPTMKQAVEAFVSYKFSSHGLGLKQPNTTGWKDPDKVTAGILPVSDEAIAATIAYCEHIYDRYGRFPAYTAPFRTMLGYQATHVDTEFYDRFYVPAALTEAQRLHQEHWHGSV